jgi:hypothetical protein
LGHGVDLIVMSPIGERDTFFDEIRHPRKHLRVGQVDIPGFNQRTDRCGAGNFAPRRIDRNQTMSA